MKLKSHFEITGIGSMPHESEKRACDTIFSNFRRIPFWPQLVNKSFLEDMMPQFSERIPGVEVDVKSKRIYIDRNRDIKEEINELNERYALEDLDYFSISEDYASGLYEYLYRLKDSDLSAIEYLKGQVTGPLSFAFTVSDEDGIPLFFDRELREAAVKSLSLKARWQAARLKNVFRDIIIFIDEPSLVFFKESASDSKIKKEDLISCINRVIGAIHTEGCYAGLHCCANADWDFALSTDADVLSFDAYNYGESFVNSYKGIANFLKRDGIIAWGMVPTTLSLPKNGMGELTEKLEGHIRFLSDKKKIDRRKVISSSLITPSCGCGTLSERDAEDVIENCVKFSQLAREKIVF